MSQPWLPLASALMLATSLAALLGVDQHSEQKIAIAKGAMADAFLCVHGMQFAGTRLQELAGGNEG
jgi:hypothetical protein